MAQENAALTTKVKELTAKCDEAAAQIRLLVAKDTTKTIQDLKRKVYHLTLCFSWCWVAW